MNVGRLKNKVRNQAAAITKLLECAKADKNLVETFKKTNTMLKGENDDLKVRCEEVEEMLRQTESKLEIANKLLAESEADLKTQTELKTMFFNSSNDAVKRIEELEADNKRLYIELQEHINKPWYKKLFG